MTVITNPAEMLKAVQARKARMIDAEQYAGDWTSASSAARYLNTIKGIRITLEANGDIVATARGTFSYVAGYVLDADVDFNEWNHILDNGPGSYRLVRNCPCDMSHDVPE